MRNNEIEIVDEFNATVHLGDDDMLNYQVPADRELKKSLKAAGEYILSGKDLVVRKYSDSSVTVFVPEDHCYCAPAFMDKLKVLAHSDANITIERY